MSEFESPKLKTAGKLKSMELVGRKKSEYKVMVRRTQILRAMAYGNRALLVAVVVYC